MRLRQQLPVYSPLSAAAIGAASRSFLKLGGRGTAESLETALAGRYGSQSVLLTDSGTSALFLALSAALRDRPGSMVALPAYGCYDMATAAVGAGASVLLYDLDPLTLGPDFGSLARALERGAVVVVIAHLYGIPADMTRVREIGDQHQAIILEDAAQGADGRLNGRPLGSWGSVSVLSFGRGKGTTGGGGGALLAHDPQGVRILGSARTGLRQGAGLRSLLLLWAQWLLGRPEWYGIPSSMPFLKLGETIYHDPWVPSRMSGVSAGTLSVTLGLSEGELQVRRRNAARLLAALVPDSVLRTVALVTGAEPGYLRLPVIAENGGRSELLKEQARCLGVLPGYPTLLRDLPSFGARCVNRDEEFPGAGRLERDLFTMPTHSLLSEDEMNALETLARFGVRR